MIPDGPAPGRTAEFEFGCLLVSTLAALGSALAFLGWITGRLPL